MNNTRRCLAGIAGALLVCILIVGAASAYDPDAACASLKEVIAGSGDLTALELVYEYSDGATSCLKIWTESCPNAGEEMVTDLQEAFKENAAKKRDFSRVVFTAVAGKERTSYELSPKTSTFVMLAEAIKFPLDIPEFEDIVEDEIEPGNLVRYNPKYLFDVIPEGGSYYTQYAYSYTDPVAYYPFMTAETRLLKKVGLRWQTHRVTSITDSYVPDIDARDPNFALTSGEYRHRAHYSGVRDDYSSYSDDKIGEQFTV